MSRILFPKSKKEKIHSPNAKLRASRKYLSNKKSFTTYVDASVGEEMELFCKRKNISKKSFVEKSAKHMVKYSAKRPPKRKVRT